MQGHTVSGAHVIYTALGAMGVMLIASLYWGRSFRSNVLAFCIGFVFLLALYALGVKAAAWAMVLIVAIIVLGVVSTALS